MKAEIQSFMFLPIAMILGLIVVALWIHAIFLGLFGGSVANEIKIASEGAKMMKLAIAEKKDKMGSWTIHTKLALFFIILTIILIILRRPIVTMGWFTPKFPLGESVTYIAVTILIFSVAANYYFCRYYCCRLPRTQKPIASLTNWKSTNKDTPWAEIFMLASGFGFIIGLRESGLLKLIQTTIVERNLGKGGCHFWAALMGLIFTSIAPATGFAQFTLFDIFDMVRIFKIWNRNVKHNEKKTQHKFFICSRLFRLFLSHLS